MKKLFCIFLGAILILTAFTFCGKEEEVTEPAEITTTETTTAPIAPREITLGYFEGKGFNPYKTTSPLNRSLMTLVYDTLYLAGDGYSVSPLIAASSERDGRKLTVQIADELYFSDGSLIDASDVVYSFNLAKKDSFYSDRLINIASASGSDSTVIFTLLREDIYAESCLIFPIIKAGTAGDKIPEGSGRYTLRKSGGDYYLKANSTTSRKEEMTTEKINLVPVSSEKSELYLLQTGDLTYFFDDLSDGEYTKVGANMVKMPLNNLVFVSFNSETGVFSDKSLAAAVNLAIDRTAVCDSAFEGIYRKAKSVFNPDWYVVSAIEETPDTYNLQKAENILEEAGYVYAYSHNLYRSKNFDFLEMTLLVCSDTPAKLTVAEEIKKSLNSIGIDLKIEAKEYSEYISALKRGEFDLYIGEIKLGANMDLSPFFAKDGSANYGIDTSSVTAAAYFDFAKGVIDISTFVQVFDSELPFIPLCYRDGMSYFSRELSYEGSTNEYEPFRNIYSWEV